MINSTEASYTIAGSASAGDDYTNPSGTVTIPANAGNAPIVVSVMDDSLIEGAETVTLTITGTNHAAITVNPAADNDTASSTAGGTFTVNPDGTVNYLPPPGFVGFDSFVYEVCDDSSPAACQTAIVSVTLTESRTDPVPTALSDTARVMEDSSQGVMIAVLDNDSHPTDSLEIDSVTSPANGSVTINPDGTVTYVPDPGFSGVDTFTYTVVDENGDSIVAPVTVGVSSLVSVEFAAASNANPEGGSGDLPQLLINGVLDEEQTIDVVMIGGSAANGTDFRLTVTVTIPPGTYDGALATAQAIMLTIVDDTLIEGDEDIHLTLRNPSVRLAIDDANGDTVTQTNNQYTIVDDEMATVGIEVIRHAMEPTTDGQFSVRIDGGRTSITATTVVYTIDGTADGYGPDCQRKGAKTALFGGRTRPLSHTAGYAGQTGE